MRDVFEMLVLDAGVLDIADEELRQHEGPLRDAGFGRGCTGHRRPVSRRPAGWCRTAKKRGSAIRGLPPVYLVASWKAGARRHARHSELLCLAHS